MAAGVAAAAAAGAVDVMDDVESEPCCEWSGGVVQERF